METVGKIIMYSGGGLLALAIVLATLALWYRFAVACRAATFIKPENGLREAFNTAPLRFAYRLSWVVRFFMESPPDSIRGNRGLIFSKDWYEEKETPND